MNKVYYPKILPKKKIVNLTRSQLIKFEKKIAADYEQAKIKGQITGALIYPILVLVLAISVSLGLLIFIVPKFKDMFDNMGAELPGLTSFMLNV